MLTPSIHAVYDQGVATLGLEKGGCRDRSGPEPEGQCRGKSALFEARANAFFNNPRLEEEGFGASSLLVSCRNFSELLQVLEALDGQLTATIHCDADDTEQVRAVMPLLVAKAGRVLANGWPMAGQRAWK